MRFLWLSALFLAGCTGEANHLGTPLLWPFQAVTTGIENTR